MSDGNALREAWLRIWAQRFDKEDGKYVGPDTYYAGIAHAAAAVSALASELGIDLHKRDAK